MDVLTDVARSWVAVERAACALRQQFNTRDWSSAMQVASPRRRGMDGKETTFAAGTEMVQPHRAALTEEEKVLREKVLQYIWKFYVKDEIGCCQLDPDKAKIMYDSTLMDRIEGWHAGEE